MSSQRTFRVIYRWRDGAGHLNEDCEYLDAPSAAKARQAAQASAGTRWLLYVEPIDDPPRD